MRITLILVGKTTETPIKELMDMYIKRLKHYCTLQVKEIPGIKDKKNIPIELQKKKEAEIILGKLDKKDHVILMDEAGSRYSSVKFADWLDSTNYCGYSNLVFIVGGSQGFAKDVYRRADKKISLSDMTFPHQLVRVIFLEQLYRACTITKGEKYHHE